MTPNRQWSRSDDRLIAERCENAKPIRRNKLPDNAQRWVWPDGHTDFLPEYNLEPAAEIRAAEGWRKQKPGRSYAIYSARGGDYIRPSSAELTDVHEDGALQMPLVASTLHEALLAACEKEGA